MRIPFAPSILLAILSSTVVVSAHASTMDDFLLIGEGNTITYSLPDSAIVMDHPHGVTTGGTALTNINGVSGYSITSLYYVPRLPDLPSMVWYGPSSIDGGVLALYGPWVVSDTVIPISDPTPDYTDNLLVTFVPGTYDFSAIDGTSVVSYTLTITPEAAPEPASLGLFATGLLSVLGIAGIRRRCVGTPEA